MLYDLTLRDLSIVGTQFGVCLRLHGYPEVRGGASVPEPDSFVAYMVAAKAVGYRFIAAGSVPTINAVEPPDDDDLLAAALADANSSELRPDDVMYRVANEYASHQWMREAIREALVKHGPKLQRARRASSTGSRRRTNAEAELKGLHQSMCMLSLWLSLHDPEFANSMRQRVLDCFKVYKRAILTVACTENRAYVRNISSGVTDLTEALGVAENSTQSSIFPG